MNEQNDATTEVFPAKQISIQVHQEATGIPILFIHGYPLDSSIWSAQLEHFRKKHVVIAIDLPGFGASGPVSNHSGDGEYSTIEYSTIEYSMASLADDCIDGLNSSGIDGPVVVCGLSMGGYVAFEIWKRHPSRIKALILCDTRAGTDTVEAAKNRLIAAERVLTEGTAAVVTPMLERLIAPQTREASPALVERLLAMMHAVPPTTIALAQRAMAARADFTDQLYLITQPTLMIVGDLDVITTPQEMSEMAARIPHARFRLIANSGHLTLIEQPAQFNAAIDEFLLHLQ